MAPQQQIIKKMIKRIILIITIAAFLIWEVLTVFPLVRMVVIF